MSDLSSHDAQEVHGSFCYMLTRPSSKGASSSNVHHSAGSSAPTGDESYKPPARLHAKEVQEVQNKRCTVSDYEGLPMCRSCKSGVPGEHCRFRKARLVARAPDGSARPLGTFASGSGFALSTYDGTGATDAERQSKQHILKHVCATLTSLVDEERALLPPNADIVVATSQLTVASFDPSAEARAAIEHRGLPKGAPGERQLCDWCNTTIMCHYAECPVCGFEACVHCAAEWREHGKPDGLHKACCHPVECWTYFRRIDTNALQGLEERARAWSAEAHPDLAAKRASKDATSKAAKGRGAAAGHAKGPRNVPGEQAAGATCLACIGRHRPHTCGRQRTAKAEDEAPALARSATPLVAPRPSSHSSTDELRQREAAQRESWLLPLPKPSPSASPSSPSSSRTANPTPRTPPAAPATPPMHAALQPAVATTPPARVSKRERKPSAIVIAAAESAPPKPGRGLYGFSTAQLLPGSSAGAGAAGWPARAGDRHAQPLRLRLDAASDETRFLATWGQGAPVVVTGIGSRFKEKWTPQSFSITCGHLEVPLIDTRTGANFERPLRDFLSGFRRPSARPKPPIKSRGKAPEVGSAAAKAAAAAATSAAAQPADTLLKLKDWPDASDFAEFLPRHFNDFMRALPLRQYTLRDAPLNLASTLPKWCLPPDLGPKMYFGFGSLAADGSFARHVSSSAHVAGTCLHVDMADAVNICCHVEPLCRDGNGGGDGPSSMAAKRRRLSLHDGRRGGGSSEDAEEEAASDDDEEAERHWLLGEGDDGAAVWDIWHSRDAETISNFLIRVAREEGRKPCAHGIHDQTFYVDAVLRRRLEEEEGVIGWRFVQRAGDAVFIPAGCPHQVLNLRSCIKTAMDFVSPEHMDECLRLTEQFRRLPRGHPRQDDPLASKVVVLHAVTHALSTLSSS